MRARLTTLVGATATAVLGALLVSTGAGSAGASSAPATVTTHPRQIALSSDPLPNSMRGQYDWSGQGTHPSTDVSPDLYYRDQVPWSRVEPERGTFDYTYLDAGLAQAGAQHGRFGFRVLAWCPGCFDNQYTHAWTKDSWTPSWLAKQGDTAVPDWNSESFLSDWEDLMHHLGDRYAADPALGWVDVGGYGRYGEWQTESGGGGITPEDAERMARAVLDNFPTQHVVLNAMDPALVDPVLAISPRMGLRTDCLGAPQTYSLLASSAPGSLIAERWQTAPVLSEWCHSDDDTTRGARQVTKYHVSMVSSGNTPQPYADLPSAQQAGFREAARLAGYRYGITSVTVPRTVHAGASFAMTLAVSNTGSAPTYDDWDPRVQVLRTDNTLVSEQSLALPLTPVLPGTRSRTRTVSLPSVPKGSYQLRLVVRDPKGYLDPMWLSDTGRRKDGSYPLGALTVS